VRVGARVGSARIQSMLANHLQAMGEEERAEELRQSAVDEMRRLGDRRATAELLIEAARPTQTYAPIAPSSLREAQDLAEEIGWSEGVSRASGGYPARARSGSRVRGGAGRAGAGARAEARRASGRAAERRGSARPAGGTTLATRGRMQQRARVSCRRGAAGIAALLLGGCFGLMESDGGGEIP